MNIAMEGPGKNSLGTKMMGFLLEGLARAGGEPILLTGTGGTFSSGLDLKEVAGLDEPGMLGFLTKLEETVSALYQYPGPVVALVNGHAIAGGCVLATCCDWRVMVDDAKAKIGLNEVALGLRFPPRTLAIVRDRVPRPHHEDVLLGAGLFDPKAALRVGLVDELGTEATAQAVLDRLSALPRRAYAETKRDLRGWTAAHLCSEAEWKRRMDEMIPVWTSPEIKQKVLAALGKG